MITTSRRRRLRSAVCDLLRPGIERREGRQQALAEYEQAAGHEPKIAAEQLPPDDEQIDVLPDVSVAEQDTPVFPSGKVEPEAGTQPVDATPQLSLTVGAP